MSRARCRSCGDRIGVYEPLVVIRAGEPPRESSLAAEPQALELGSDLYHRDCYSAPAEETAGPTSGC